MYITSKLVNCTNCLKHACNQTRNWYNQYSAVYGYMKYVCGVYLLSC